MSRHAHIFVPGKDDPYRCSYKLTIRNPDGEDELISCGEHRLTFPHVPEGWEKMAKYAVNDPDASWNQPK